MKLKYEKPMVAVDRYELSQSIAGCVIIVNYTDSNCFLNSGVPDLFKELASSGWFVGGCALFTQDGASFDGVCIHTSANAALTS
jgi:hypothetical protein